MEPIHGHLGLGELPGDGDEEGGRHVADHFFDVGCIAAVRFQKGLERLDRLLALARRGKDHRIVLAVGVDEHGDVVVPRLDAVSSKANALRPERSRPRNALAT